MSGEKSSVGPSARMMIIVDIGLSGQAFAGCILYSKWNGTPNSEYIPAQSAGRNSDDNPYAIFWG